MNFSFTDEQRILRDTLARYIEKDYGFEARRAAIKSATGFRAEAWRQFADMGLLALPFSEGVGGLGGDGADTYIVMEAFGHGLLVEPYLATIILGGGLLELLGSPTQRQEWLPRLIAGDCLLALAHGETEARYDLSHVTTSAALENGSYRLNGAKSVVLHGAQANLLLVSARLAGASTQEITLFLLDPASAGVTLRDYRGVDGTRAADVQLREVRIPAHAVLGAPGQALPAIEQIADRAGAALCAEAIGAMDALIQATLEYLKTRQQFGVPIGRFQALQHRMVDMLIQFEQAKSMAYLAAVHANESNAERRRRAIAAARVQVAEAARFIGQQAVQLHGGIGVTDELVVSHYFKRLTMINQTLGDADHHLRYYAQQSWDLLL